MYSHTLRYRIATGSFTLPVVALITLLAWITPARFADSSLWGGLGMVGVTAYLLTELNNRNALLRVRSRMVSSTFLLAMAACPTLHNFSPSLVPMTCMALSYFMLFDSYQRIKAEGYIFHAFLFASVGSLTFPPFLICPLLYYVSMIFQLRNFTWRTFMAGILGLAVPYWIYAAFAIWHNRLDTAFLYLLDWAKLPLPDYSSVTLPQWVTGGTLTVLSAAALIHFFHTAYNDKIRVRMFFYCIVTQELALMAGLILLPQYFTEILPILILNSAPLLAHHLTLLRGRWGEWWFYLALLSFAVMAYFNYTA